MTKYTKAKFLSEVGKRTEMFARFFADPTFEVSGIAARQSYTHPNDDFVQAGDLYRKVMTDEARAHLIGNIVSHLGNA